MRFTKKLIPIILILTTLLGVFFINIGTAKAGWNPLEWSTFGLLAKGGIALGGNPFADIVGTIAEDLIGGLVYVLWSFSKWFIGICSNLFTSVLNFTTNALGTQDNRNLIYDGWQITRDIVNMFFILGLVVIAFATILRIEPYGMKALLMKFIIVALLINFSFLICGVIIDASHVIANSFLNSIRISDPSNLGFGGQMQSALLDIGNEDVSSELPGIPDKVDLMIAQMFLTVINIGAAFIFLMGAILLTIRMLGLWVLIILAPFAWFFSIFPKLNSMSGKWWSNFMKYTFFAPIYIFFVWLALSISARLNIPELNITAPEGFTEALKPLAQYFVILLLLGGAPIVAMSAGIHGSQAVTKSFKGAFRGTAKLALRTGERFMVKPPEWSKKVPGLKNVTQAWEKYGKYVGFLSPTIIKEGLKAREARMRRRAMEPAVGDTFDVLNRIYSLGKDKTFRGDEARERIAREREKEIAYTGATSDILVANAGTAAKAKQPQDLIANLRMLANQKDFDMLSHLDPVYGKYNYVEYLEEKAKETYGDKWKENMPKYLEEEENFDPEDIKELGENWDEIKENSKMHNVANPYAQKRLIFKMLMDSGLSEHQAGAQAAQLAHLTFAQGDHTLYKMANFKDGKWVMASDKEQEKVSNAKLATGAPRYFFQHGTPRDFMTISKKDGKPMGLHKIGIERLKNMSVQQIADMCTRLREWREDTRQGLSEDNMLRDLKTQGKRIGGKHQEVFEFLADKLEQYKHGEAEKAAPKKPKRDVGKEVDEKRKEYEESGT